MARFVCASSAPGALAAHELLELLLSPQLRRRIGGRLRGLIAATRTAASAQHAASRSSLPWIAPHRGWPPQAGCEQDDLRRAPACLAGPFGRPRRPMIGRLRHAAACSRASSRPPRASAIAISRPPDVCGVEAEIEHGRRPTPSPDASGVAGRLAVPLHRAGNDSLGQRTPARRAAAAGRPRRSPRRRRWRRPSPPDGPSGRSRSRRCRRGRRIRPSVRRPARFSAAIDRAAASRPRPGPGRSARRRR